MKTIKGAELFAVGAWNGIEFTSKDIDGIVASFDALSLAGRVPLKMSHDGPDPRDDLLNKFALGWVRRIWRDGDKILGDLEVPDKVHEAVSEGFLRHISVELLKNVRADTRVIPWVLDAVAVLGADQPAVGILQALMQRGPAALKGESRMAFKREVTTTLEITKMTEAEMQAEISRLKKLAEDQKAEFERKETERVKAEGDSRRKKALEMFAAAVKSGHIVPATTERFMRNAAPPEGDARWATFDMDLVTQCIEENPKDPKKAFSRQQAAGGVGSGTDEESVMQGMNASQRMVFKVQRYAEAQGLDLSKPDEYDRAAKAVFSSDRKLADSYKNFSCAADEAA